MGADKGGLEYHGAPQARWAFDLLARHCDRVFVSVRDAAQAAEPAYAGLPAVVDLGPSAGPATGVVAALRLEPQRAWLVVAAGEVEIEQGGSTVSGGSGFVAHFDPKERHEVRATSDSRLVLILAPWPGEGHPSQR